METITVQIFKDDVYEEVAKATDYTGAKLIDGDDGARDRILATDSDLSDLGRFWEESVLLFHPYNNLKMWRHRASLFRRLRRGQATKPCWR